MDGKFYEGARKLYRRVKIVFIGSLDHDGFPNIKAVLVTDKKSDMSEIIMKTNTSSRHVRQLMEHPQGCLYFIGLLGFKGVMLRGTFTVVEDAALKGKYWRKGDEKYYAKGEADYCLLVFTPADGRYYHNLAAGDFTVAR